MFLHDIVPFRIRPRLNGGTNHNPAIKGTSSRTPTSPKRLSTRFEVRRITDGKRRRKKLLELKQELRRRMHAPIAQVGEWLRSVLRGYYQYHAVPGNLSILSRFRHQAARLWFRTLSQRSQRRPTWEKLGPIINHWSLTTGCRFLM